ncbi:Uncharacterised protein [Legionella cincinnatiensis]|uniref:Uncharacterized protein n=1 Tax=Legionella cincinnatiensis TaxID=28085 RepID=A0A378IGH1_9GAMM|nr:Uncharacterised protein [Legionella cincinnatiensis]
MAQFTQLSIYTLKVNSHAFFLFMRYNSVA